MAVDNQSRVDNFAIGFLKSNGDIKDKSIQRWHLSSDLEASGVFASGIMQYIRIGESATPGDVLTADASGRGTWQPASTSFLSLTDTPATYSGMAASGVRVKLNETGLEFYNAISGGGGGGSAAYNMAFTNTDLVNGILLVPHSLGNKYVFVQVYDNNDMEIQPKENVLISAATCAVDLTPFAPIAGTWHTVVSGGALVPETPSFARDGSVSPANRLSNGNFEAWSAGLSNAPDSWVLQGTDADVGWSDLAGGGHCKIGTYSVGVTRYGHDCLLEQLVTLGPYQSGVTFTFGCWAYATVANRARIGIYDSVSATWTHSTYHTGNSSWEFLSISATMAMGAIVGSYVSANCIIDSGDTSAYFDGAILTEGAGIWAFSDKPLICGTNHSTVPVTFPSRLFISSPDSLGVYSEVISASTSVSNASGTSYVMKNGSNTNGNFSVLLAADYGSLYQGVMGAKYNAHGTIASADWFIEPKAVVDPTTFVVKANGYIGIGTSNPGRMLHVYNGSYAAAIRIEGGYAGGRSWEFGDGITTNGKFTFRDNTANAVRVAVDSTGNVGIGTASPAGILDVTSTTAAFLPPRMTTTQKNAIAGPVAGMVVYDTTLGVLSFHNGVSWGNV